MKILLSEICDPVKDFYSMRWKKKKEIVFFAFIPFLLGILFLVCDVFLSPVRFFDLDEFISDMLNQLVTVLTLFISFSMAYLSILITSGSSNVDDLKRKESGEYSLEKGDRKVTLYQVLMDEITYTLIVEIGFLLFIFFQKFLYLLCKGWVLKILIAIDISFLVHVLLLMVVTVKNIYFSFWRSK
jgi:hypothetical protein